MVWEGQSAELWKSMLIYNSFLILINSSSYGIKYKGSITVENKWLPNNN